MKRLFDAIAAFFGLLVLSPILLPVMYLVWRQDRCSPFYIAPRVGKDGVLFKMIKLRSMVVNAENTGVDSTGANDMRITPIGKFIRSCKLDELTQLWNVLLGDMSLVGPRPNVLRETELYTDAEKKLLLVKPGITDIASIVFSDEGDILVDKSDPDLSYNQLIRPWKSRLGLLYIENQSFRLDFKLILITIVAIVNRKFALELINTLLNDIDAEQEVIDVSERKNILRPSVPPGARHIVTGRT